MKLVPDWHQAWRWFSVQALAVIGALPLVWITIPEETRDWVPVEWRVVVLSLLAAAGILGRVVDQNKGAQP